MHERRIDEQRAGLVAHRTRLMIRHAFEHLDLDGVAHAVRLAQHERERHVEEIVTAHAHAHRRGVRGLAGVFQHAAEVRVGVRLHGVGRGVPAVQLGLDGFHREIRALHQPHLDLRAARRHTPPRPPGQLALRRVRVRQICLEDDARAQRLELRLVEHFAECRDREREVAVFLHVEIHEFPIRRRRAVELAQPDLDLRERRVPCEQVDLAENGGDFHRHIINVWPREQPQHGVEAMSRLLLAEDRLAELVHIHARALGAARREIPRQRRGFRGEDDAAAVMPEPPPHRRHDHRGQDS